MENEVKVMKKEIEDRRSSVNKVIVSLKGWKDRMMVKVNEEEIRKEKIERILYKKNKWKVMEKDVEDKEFKKVGNWKVD